MWLTLVKGLSTRKKLNLLQNYNFDISKLYHSTKEELLKIEGIGEKLSEYILDENTKKEVHKHIEYMDKNGINFISYSDTKYPNQLKEIYDPPIGLYIIGNTDVLNSQKNIAVIGCRECSQYGKNVALDFSAKLSENQVTIVSGLAKGIDSYAHKGAINKMQKTIAVLGNGLDIIYPKENIELAKEIIKYDGAIISEYPLGTKPEKNNFPERNRIVSGISDGIVVIEAKKKSGTLITVDFALEQGRDVYVIPGNITSENSEGTNELIKQGAKLVTSIEDILEN